MPDRHLVDVHILLLRDTALLLSRRRGDAFDGLWHLPSGKLDAGEDALTAAAREAREEVGVLIEAADLTHVHTVHAIGPGLEPRLGLFFATTRWLGEPANREPGKCWELGWFDVDDLPADLIEYPKAGITGYREGTPFSLLGWSSDPGTASPPPPQR